MAVQKSKKSRSKRDTRRSHDHLKNPTLSENMETGEIHIRHHLTNDGYYGDKKMANIKKTKKIKTKENPENLENDKNSH